VSASVSSLPPLHLFFMPAAAAALQFTSGKSWLLPCCCWNEWRGKEGAGGGSRRGGEGGSKSWQQARQGWQLVLVSKKETRHGLQPTHSKQSHSQCQQEWSSNGKKRLTDQTRRVNGVGQEGDPATHALHTIHSLHPICNSSLLQQ
jgi:hypothetical protein